MTKDARLYCDYNITRSLYKPVSSSLSTLIFHCRNQIQSGVDDSQLP